MITEKVFWGRIRRVIILIVLILFINWLFYSLASSSLYDYLPFKASDLAKIANQNCDKDNSTEVITNENNLIGLSTYKDFEFNDILNKLEDKIEKSDTKLFKNFIEFDVYIENSIKTENGEVIKFNVDIDGKYREVDSNKGKVFFT
ncbi:hypothetical protein KKD72_02870, partial [Patescibacteria group bacterium]|nr:hypothetical protein [Patescibacteria group bacterium]